MRIGEEVDTDVQDFLLSELLEGSPSFRVFMVGHRISNKVEPARDVGERARIQVATYGQIVRSAYRRLFRLRERLATRYEKVAGEDMLSKLLAEPQRWNSQGIIPN
jgi:hypothetical protein